MHGMVLTEADCDYADLAKFGRVTIEFRRGKSVGLFVTVDGFEFTRAASCRAHGTKAVAWARDVLSVALEAHRLAPGASVSVCIGLDQDDLKAQQDAERF